MVEPDVNPEAVVETEDEDTAVLQQAVNGHKIRFFPLLALVMGVVVVLTFLYTLIIPGLSTRGWSDSLCVSVFVLALGSAMPVFLDAGRGARLAGKMGGSKKEQHEAFVQERTMREKGMRVTFVLVVATFLTGLLSVLISLL
ncbi:MAG: hypothetical protein P1S60_10700 [Anaerolineae bacterium]|nr:hypothetical protein [Anaerolineae bacterium]